MYYVSPIAGLHNIDIIEVDIVKESNGQCGLYLVTEVKGAGSFRTSIEYLHKTKASALEQLTRNTLDFLDKVVHSYNKATEDFNG